MKYKNPSTNRITPQVKKQIDVAISNSGYPLQLWTAELLRKKFYLEEEWAYKDKRDDNTRTIDILTEKEFWKEELEDKLRIRPELNLIIECKQSKSPFVFFISKNKTFNFDMPQIAGLSSNNIEINTDDDRSTWGLDINLVLEANKYSFISSDPKYSTVFSKMSLKGDKSILSGEDSYLNIILPLIDAVNYFKKCQSPPKTAMYFDFHMIFAIGVLDAPMIGVEVNKNKHTIANIPWVRMRRWETVSEPTSWKMGDTIAIDLVHKDFLEIYLNEHLLPFVDRYAKSAIKHQLELADGKGFVSKMNADSFNNLESRLKRKK